MANRDRDTQKSNHSGITSQVHGLPSGAHVLGNKTAGGQFIQHASCAPGASANNGYHVSFPANLAVTFAVAFAVTPRVFVGAAASDTGGYGCWGGAYNNSTTGFNMWAFGIQAFLAFNWDYLAIGS